MKIHDVTIEKTLLPHHHLIPNTGTHSSKVLLHKHWLKLKDKIKDRWWAQWWASLGVKEIILRCVPACSELKSYTTSVISSPELILLLNFSTTQYLLGGQGQLYEQTTTVLTINSTSEFHSSVSWADNSLKQSNQVIIIIISFVFVTVWWKPELPPPLKPLKLNTHSIQSSLSIKLLFSFLTLLL